MSHAAKPISSRCSIKRLKSAAPILPAAILCALLACSQTKTVAQKTVAQAEQLEARLAEENVPEDVTLSYRISLSNARKAYEKGRYAEARKEGEAAIAEVERIFKSRETLSNDLRLRLERIKLVIQSQPHPSSLVLDSYFNALEAFGEKRYEECNKIAVELETALIREVRIADPVVAVQANQWFYESKGFIPVYASVSDNGEPGEVVFQLKKPVRAKFLGSKIFTRELYFVHISIGDGQGRVEGWVEKRFVE